jgi:hypothetical protein
MACRPSAKPASTRTRHARKASDLSTHPKVRVYVDNYMVGRTPAAITAKVSALEVLLPK